MATQPVRATPPIFERNRHDHDLPLFRVWMITGAARGIGLRIVEAALAAGDRVVATSRDVAALRERFAGNDALLPVALDVTDEAQAAAAVAAALAHFGHVDVLVNNAGFGLLGAVEEASASESASCTRPTCSAC